MSQEVKSEDRPLFVRSQNFKHSKNLKFPDEPPTDRQIVYLKKLGFSGAIPKTRKDASAIISDLLKGN